MNSFSLFAAQVKTDLIKYDPVVGSRRISNYVWGTITTLGGLCFLLTGISSFYQKNLLFFIHVDNIVFFPQGLVMCFYGLLAFLFSAYIWLTVFWAVGEGFNEFNKERGEIRIFRWGFPGKNRKINLTYKC